MELYYIVAMVFAVFIFIIATTRMPRKIKYVNRFKDGWGAGRCLWQLTQCEILILRSHKDDMGLLAHEVYHARGTVLDVWIRSIRYKFSDRFRYLEEVGAYREQLKVVHFDQRALFIRYIRNNYDLPISLTRDVEQRL